MERKLAAILAADVVGYSAMVQRDELGTIRTVKGHISAFEPHISLHQGRIFKTMGDGFLAEFLSSVEAVACAEILQRTSVQRNENLSRPERAVFRMGIHAGEVLVDGEDILGDGVNIASRLESISRPGTISVSSKVFDEIEGRLDLVFKDVGQKALKNIEKTVRVYELANGESAPVVEQTLELPDKPSIAVLPLTTFSGTMEDENLADGLTEDLTTALFHIPWLFVISRNSSFTYKGLSVDIRKISSELGVRYIVEGSVRRSGNRVRISAHLVDAADGRHIWADKFDGVLEDVFELQDRIVEEVVQAIAPQVQSAEIQKSARKRPENFTAYDLYLNALGHLNSARITDAEALLEKAIEIHPDYAAAKSVLAWCSTLHISWQSSPGFSQLHDRAIRYCYEALESSQRDSESEAYSGYTLAFHKHDIDHGMELVASAADQCSSFAWAWVSRSYLESFFGDPERAVGFGEKALRLNPRDPLMFRTLLALNNAYIGTGEFSKALSYSKEGLRHNSNIIGFRILEVIALVKLGRQKDATEAAAKLISRHPDFLVSQFRSHFDQYKNLAGGAEALQASGLPV